MCTSLPRRARCGIAAVELAVVLPFLLILLLGLWEVGRLVEVQQLLDNAVREGARQASTNKKTVAEVKDIVVGYLQRNGIDKVAPANVTVTNLTSKGASDPQTAAQMDQLEVSISLPFDNVRWILLDQQTTVKTLSATAVWCSMADSPLVLNMDIPVQ